MAGFIPAIHAFFISSSQQGVDARGKPGHGGGQRYNHLHPQFL
jgi:hypothetical protein